jgi:hypothetical protein
MQAAKKSGIPMLGFRFDQDTICTANRFKHLKDFFGDQFEGNSIDCSSCKKTMTHAIHSVLTGPFVEYRTPARRQVIQFLDANLTA